MEDLFASVKELQLALQVLLKKFNGLKKENEQFKKENEEMNRLLLEKARILNLTEEKIAVNNLNNVYNENEKQILQTKIDAYLKDIEKCLALLNAR